METENRIRVLIYEDNTDLLYTLSKIVESGPNFILLGAFPNANNVLEEVKLHQPDVILMDIDLPVTTGKEALKKVKANYPEVDIIMLTVFDDNKNIFECILSGASGYLLKITSPEKIIEAINEVKEGGAPMTPQVAKKVLQLLPRASNEIKDSVHLTPREVEVLTLLTKGYSYKMIANELNLGIETIRFYIKAIYKKLHVNSVSGAVSKAIKDRLV
jgi:DNA-binding NarL/FixJ family response regulator